MLLDMHCHLSALSHDWQSAPSGNWQFLAKREMEIRKKEGILSFLSGGTPWQWEMLLELRQRENFLSSFGIHPWYGDLYFPEGMEEYVKKCDAVGEIGMDNVWCQVDLSIQKKVFEKQLLLAADLHKPVILHTKGQERTVASMLRGFPEKVCVHWYSGSERDLEAYLERDCYFTLGPDVALFCRGNLEDFSDEKQKEAQVRMRMLREIPKNRLFLETDGISAAAWAVGEESLPLEKLGHVLRENLFAAASFKGVCPKELEAQFLDNLREFLLPDSGLSL